MRKSDGAINRFINWFLGEPLPKEYYPDVDEFGNGEEAHQIKRIAEFCLVLLIILTTLCFGLDNFLAGTPEPEWWLNIVEPWLLSFLRMGR